MRRIWGCEGPGAEQSGQLAMRYMCTTASPLRGGVLTALMPGRRCEGGAYNVVSTHLKGVWP